MHAILHLYQSPRADISRSWYKVIRTFYRLYDPYANLAHTYVCMYVGMYVYVCIWTDMSHTCIFDESVRVIMQNHTIHTYIYMSPNELYCRIYQMHMLIYTFM